MAITSYSQYKILIKNAYQRSNDTKISLTTVAGRLFSLFAVTPDAGVAPGAAVTCSRNTSGAMGQVNSDYPQYLTQIPLSLDGSGYIIIGDRLSHQSGLSGIITGSVTTNLPTAPLPRYTDGKGVFASAEIYTLIGVTGVLISASYTNQDGIAGRLTVPAVIGSAAHNTAGRSIVLPLQPGDIGIRSVESVSLATSTATAGNYGITLWKPLIVLPVYDIGSNPFLFDSILTMCGNFAKVENNACLFYSIIPTALTTGVLMVNNRFIEDQS